MTELSGLQLGTLNVRTLAGRMLGARLSSYLVLPFLCFGYCSL